MIPKSPEHALCYIDFTGQEIGIAAALSGDLMMKEMYEFNDPHMWLAIKDGAAPSDATKRTHRKIRDKYKTVSLGVLYGQSEHGISTRLGITLAEAKELLNTHKELFPTYWSWVKRVVQSAFDRGEITTKLGWGCKIPGNTNPRTIMNWPIQSTGSEILRLTMIYMHQMRVQILAPVHDAVLVSSRINQLDDLKTAIHLACSTAVAQVLDDFPLRWEVTTHYGRYFDKDGKELWQLMTQALEKLYPNVRIK